MSGWMQSDDETWSFGGLHLHICQDAAQVATRAAAFTMARLASQPALLLCAATGSSPAGLYERLAQEAAGRPDLFQSLRVIKLDEWCGLPMAHPATCEAYLRERLLQPLNVAPDRFVSLRGDAADPAAECERVANWLRQRGPIDLCVLGIGVNGHLGLNEPGDALSPFAHRATLAETSRRHTMLEASGATAKAGLTLGLAELLQSRTIVLLVTGASKRQPFARFLKGAVTTELPASLLWLHPDVHGFCDGDALPDNWKGENE